MVLIILSDHLPVIPSAPVTFFLTPWPISRHLSLEDDCIPIAVVRIGSWMRKETKISVAAERKTGKTQLLGILAG